MLFSFETSDRKFSLKDQSQLVDENVYTAITGKNGTGKSRLLKGIIDELLEDRGLSNRFEKSIYDSKRRLFEGSLHLSHFPEKIIAVSTSPFDKFPLPKRHEPVFGYCYLGLRDLMSNDLGLSYMSKIINSLIKSVLEVPERAESISNVLRYLGYYDEIYARFHLSPAISRVERFFHYEYPVEKFVDFLNSPSVRNVDRSFFINAFGKIDHEKVSETLRIFKRISDYTSKPRFDLFIGRRGVTVLDSNYNIDDDFNFLIESGIAKLRGVQLRKIDSDEVFSISDASSGEQSVVMGLLGIASQIEDSSLVCIDEPEVCLHPEWQEKYMELLSDMFREYKGCHFLIATHSPQIVSNLPLDNGYVTTMDTGECNRADKYLHRSADFQLASVFKSPGYNNEYLNRVAVNTFFKVGKNKRFDDSDLEVFNLLEENRSNIKQNSELSELIEAIMEMYLVYG